MLSFADIAKIFEEIELRLIASLKRNLRGHKKEEHKKEEQKTGFEYSSWQAEKLRNIEKFRRQNQAIMNEYTEVIDDRTRKLMSDEFREGERLANEKTGDKSYVPDTHFFGVNEKKMQSLITDITTLEKHAETAALRMTDDVYRQTVNRVQIAMGTGEMTLNKAIDIATKEFLDKGINCIVYSDGRRVNIADYVRMALRTTSTRASLQGQAKRFAELGYDTVLVSQYGGCSKTCEPWQGRAYIDDVFTLWDGEVEERENGELWGKSKYCGKWFPLLSTAIHAGLFHPNCRHTIGFYKEGSTKISEPIPAEKIKKQRELEQKQRYLERKIRRFKRFQVGSCDPETAKAYSRKVIEAQTELRELIKANEKALKRDYEREKIYFSENVDKSEKSGIIESGSDEMAEITKLGTIDTQPLEKEFGKLKTNEIIVTNERIDHIKSHHPEDYALFEQFGISTVEHPDIIIKDEKNENTVFMVKKLENTNLNVVAKLIVDTDESSYKNSVMTFYRIRNSNLKKLEKKFKTLYKRE